MNTQHRPVSITIGFALVAAFLLVGWLAMGTGAHAQENTVKVTVKLTDNSFDPAVIEVTQGATVELTFVWAHTVHLQEEHVMVIPGYKLESEKIDANHRETTVKFIAAQSGSFDYKCDLECDTHDFLQNGRIVVKPSSGGSAAQLTPSKLVVDPVSGVLVKEGTVSITATLKGDDGKPIPKAEVVFYDQREFLGDSGLVEIGVAKTLPNGFASLIYRPTTDAPRTVIAKFAGVGVYAPTEQKIALAGNPQFGPSELESTDDSLHGLKSGARVGLLVVIVGVWLTFGFMAYQAWGIKRAATGGEQG